MSYRVLYLLQSSYLILLEIKRLDLPVTASHAERYRWLQYVPTTNQLAPLDFVSMRAALPFEEREFQQGSLRFSNLEGIFHATSTREPVALRREFLMELPPALVEQLAQLP